MDAEISTDPSRLDSHFIQTFLTQTYWAKGRSRETVETCIRHSLNFGVYLAGKQIGYARVVTDYAVFAYLMDVFIEEAQRSKGYGKQLVHFVLHCEALAQVQHWKLATTDAHGLYESFGFHALAHPEKNMELKR